MRTTDRLEKFQLLHGQKELHTTFKCALRHQVVGGKPASAVKLFSFWIVSLVTALPKQEAEARTFVPFHVLSRSCSLEPQWLGHGC